MPTSASVSKKKCRLKTSIANRDRRLIVIEGHTID
jgi:hypothetical protein